MSLFKINSVDIVEPADYTWEMEDISSNGSGRTLDGVMHKDVVRQVVKLNLKFPPLTDAQVSTLLTAVNAAVYFSVAYPDPLTGTSQTKTFYVGNRKTAMVWKRDGESGLWSGSGFNLIEQ